MSLFETMLEQEYRIYEQIRPSVADTARTAVDISSTGVFSALNADGAPVGIPVKFSLGDNGNPTLQLKDAIGKVALECVAKDARCSLHVYAGGMETSVTLMGEVREGGRELCCRRRLYRVLASALALGGWEGQKEELDATDALTAHRFGLYIAWAQSKRYCLKGRGGKSAYS